MARSRFVKSVPIIGVAAAMFGYFCLPHNYVWATGMLGLYLILVGCVFYAIFRLIRWTYRRLWQGAEARRLASSFD